MVPKKRDGPMSTVTLEILRPLPRSFIRSFFLLGIFPLLMSGWDDMMLIASGVTNPRL
jgi:hypothetical protein